MPLNIYGLVASPPVRAVILTAKQLGVPYELKEVNLLKGEHLTPEYKKVNPLQKVPAIEDDGFFLGESHAIVLYLIAKYGKDDSLYPENIEKRALLNQRMYFNSNTLFPRLSEAVHGLKTTGTVPDNVVEKANAVLNQLDILLGEENWIGGTANFTVADLCILSTLENYSVVFPGLLEKHEKVTAWRQRGREAIEGYEEITRPAVKMLSEVFTNKEDYSHLKFIGNFAK